jgi:hypothetical protein
MAVGLAGVEVHLDRGLLTGALAEAQTQEAAALLATLHHQLEVVVGGLLAATASMVEMVHQVVTPLL